MRVLELLRGVADPLALAALEPDAAASGLAFDSRRVRPGDLFFCLVGVRDDGHLHAGEAVRRGAGALVVERPLPSDGMERPVPQVVVPDTRVALAWAAARWYRLPARDLNLVGVTGTNGKTTVTYMVEAILRAAGESVGRVGTVGIHDGREESPPIHTTPEPLALQSALARMRANGVGWVVMEVSSHALAQERVTGCLFHYGVLTNITRDHFDFHADHEDYVRAKLRLFGPRQGPLGDETTRTAVIHGPYARLFARPEVAPRFQRGDRVVRFGTGTADDVRAVDVRADPEGTSFRVRHRGDEFPVRLRMPGAHNVENALAAAAVMLQESIPPDVVRQGLESLAGVLGRAQRVDCGQPFTVLVDFAHNPAGLEAVLRLAPPRAGGRRLIVFGAEGERDRGKRAQMGQVVSRMADYAVITSDNPHGEPPERILSDVAAGWEPDGCPFDIVVDRGLAIALALDAARPGDLVIIAGKGHERAIVYDSHSVPFSDVAVAERHLMARLAGDPHRVESSRPGANDSRFQR